MITPVNFDDISEISSKWKSLERRANQNIFLSWSWIGKWLDLLDKDVFLVEAVNNTETLGLGLFVENKRKVFGIAPVKQWLLHRTGDPKKDQIWIEHNDFLLDEKFAQDVRIKMMDSILKHDPSIREYVFGLSKDDVLNSLAQCFNNKYFQRTIVDTSGYSVDLKNIEGKYLSNVVSKNTRSQIRRSKKLLQESGSLTFNVLKETRDISILFEQISAIHIELWNDSVDGSGFSNPIFVNFYQQLVDEEGIVEVAMLSLDETKLGYLVNFIYRERVYFYLSSVTKSSDKRIKTGLVLHSEAVEYYQNRNLKSYDFLGGKAQYKQSLSDCSYSLKLSCFTKKGLLLNLENWIRHLNPLNKWNWYSRNGNNS